MVETGGNAYVRERTQWDSGANLVCVSPGVVFAYDRNTYTNTLLRKAGHRGHHHRRSGARPRPRRRPLHDLSDHPGCGGLSSGGVRSGDQGKAPPVAGITTGQSPMSSVSTSGIDHLHRAEYLPSKWGWFLALGVVLTLCGTLAVALPAVSTFAASVVLGIALSFAGAVKMIQSLQVKEWSGFFWQELTGAVELVGGILIFFNPLKGAFAITLVIALVFLLQGLLQIALAIRVRGQAGWRWLLVSGLVALATSAALTLKLPYTRIYTPGTIAGISLLVAGARVHRDLLSPCAKPGHEEARHACRQHFSIEMRR